MQIFRNNNLQLKLFFPFIAMAYIVSLGFMFQHTGEDVKTIQNQNEKTTFILNALTNCYKNQSRIFCLKEAVNDIYKRFSLADFQNTIKQNESNEPVFNTCHEASHYIGRLAYQDKKDIKTLFNQCQHICLDGCYHGVVEGYFIDKNITLSEENVPAIASEVAKICGKETDYETPELYISCLHGLGHAVMFITDNELPQALNLCDSLKDSNKEELCYTGAFMANVDSRNNKDHPTKYLKADDPMYPCNILPKKHQKKCYEYNTLTFYQFTNYNWQETIKLCGQVPQDYRWGCYQTMGGDQVGFTDSVVKIKEACDEIPGGYLKMACINGAESNLVMRYSENFDKPLEFCDIVNEHYKETCFNVFIRVLNRWSRSKDAKTPICLRIKDEIYKKQCLRSIN